MRILKACFAFIMDSLETITFVGSLYIVVYIFLFTPTVVNGASMEPTFGSGDRVIISKVSYKLTPPERGDVVVIESPRNPDIQFIKRIVALPGETLRVKNGKLFINEKPLSEDYTSSDTQALVDGFLEENQLYRLLPNEVFVMGDNRAQSSDSRSFGPIPYSSIVGKVVFRYFPPEKFNPIHTRYPPL